MTDNPWRRCTDCDVQWRGEPECWSCGNRGQSQQWGPAIGSQAGHGTAMSERQWAEVRRQIL